MGSLWNRSGIVERYADDIRADGAKAFFFEGGTTTPLTVYRDSGSSSAHPIPVLADGNGRWPDVFVPYVIGYDVQVKSKDDVQLTFSLGIPNPDPVDLSVVIPAEERIQTGMIHGEFINAVKAGYVRLNGRTIGNPASLATERANIDTLNLFSYLWNNMPDTVATVSSGRGASAGADFSANKNIVLPSMRGASFIGLDDMGNTAANAFAGLTFNVGSATQAGSSIGANSVTLSSAQMPAHAHTGTTSTDGNHSHTGQTSTVSAFHTHAGTTGFENQGIVIQANTADINSSLDHTHNYADRYFAGASQTAPGGGNTNGTSQVLTDTTAGANSGMNHTHFFSGSQVTNHNHNFGTGSDSTNHLHFITADGNHSHTFTTSTVGGTTPINNIPVSRLVTWFIKL